MTIQTFTFNPFQTNCFICHDAGEAVLIDPSAMDAGEQAAVLAYLEKHKLTIRHLLLTHAHIDHIFGCAFFAKHFGDTFQMHRADLPLLTHSEQQAHLFGVSLETPPAPKHFLAEGDILSFGTATWQVLHTPGHSPGSICFWDEANRVVIAGDVLFQGSIGRTDLWQGSMPKLMTSIFQELLPLGDDVRVYPGHGPATSIGEEQRSNPFLTDAFSRL